MVIIHVLAGAYERSNVSLNPRCSLLEYNLGHPVSEKSGEKA